VMRGPVHPAERMIPMQSRVSGSSNFIP